MAIFSRPKYSTISVKKKDIPEGMWTRCPLTGEAVYTKDLEENFMVVPRSGYHFRLPAWRRIELLCDSGTFHEMFTNLKTADPLEFNKGIPYLEEIEKNRKKTGLDEAVICGSAKLNGIDIALAVMDFRFLGGSMGCVVGEKITCTIEYGLNKRIPVVIVSSSGGARMHEGILSLMQMAKTAGALSRLNDAKIPYISVLTNPTTGGVMASFASLGDIIIAEPGALIGFAGPRVIKETTHQDLPPGFQTSEFLMEHGLIDQVVDRLKMKDRIEFFLRSFGYGPKVKSKKIW
jgi:acetyl-CoA carboxylase carboxyl transferase subunit beta